MKENSYGIIKRFEFIKKTIEQQKPLRVLDFGCGTGSQVTYPLAKSFPGIEFIGVDIDPSSIEFAKGKNISNNLLFTYPEEINKEDKFDLIIASEIIEHVEQPEEFLNFLKEKLTNNGKIIITLPNGYGPFEIASLIKGLLNLCVKTLKKNNEKPRMNNEALTAKMNIINTLAVSPHINFFSYKQIYRLIRKTGLNILQYKPRTFLCGYGFDKLIRGKILVDWNAKISEFLPPYFNSDWMFILEKGNKGDNYSFKINSYVRIHRYVNRVFKL